MSRPFGTPHRLTADEMRKRLRRMEGVDTAVLSHEAKWSLWNKRAYYKRRLREVGHE